MAAKKSPPPNPPEESGHGLGDVLSFIGGVNPLAVAGKAVETMVNSRVRWCSR